MLLAECAELAQPEQGIDPGAGYIKRVRNDGRNKNPYLCLKLVCHPACFA
jgi:hypothetical protein